MTAVTLENAVAYAANIAIEAGNAMEAAFSSARAGDRDGSLSMAKEATGKAMLARKVLSTALRSQTYAAYDASRIALGHAEDARLFAKAAMDVVRGSTRNATARQANEAIKKSTETMAFLMAAASALLDIKRGGDANVAIRKVALAVERAAASAEEAAKVGGAGNGYAEDAKAAHETATEISRRAVWAAKDLRRTGKTESPSPKSPPPTK